MILGATFQSLARSDAAERLGQALLLVAAVAFAAAVLWYFHDRFWWPPDEGHYAHIADRILAGQVLNRDIQDIHPGYVNWVNAAALRAFGHDLVSLRYPLVGLGVIGSWLIFLLLAPCGGWFALAGSVGFTALSVVQFLNPTAHWYGLFIFLLIVAALTWLPASFSRRPEVLGFLIVLLTLFRQLSGTFVAIGTVAFLLSEERGEHARSDGWAGRALIAVMAAGLGSYLWAKADLVSFVMFGAWPMLALAWAAFATRAGGRELLALCARLALGGGIAAAPLLAYHLVHGSLSPWLQDTVLAAIGLTGLEFMSGPSFAVLPLLGLRGVLAHGTLAESINGLLWLLLFSVPLLLGASTLHALWRSPTPAPGHPLPFLALFYGLVSVHYQIPIYLFYTVGVALAGVLWLAASWGGVARIGTPALAVLLSVIALHYQAAQPLSRGITGVVAGERIELSPERWGSRVGLHVERADAALYGRLIATVEARVAPDETILALPFNPELYFLTGRRNPFRFTNSALGIRSGDELAAALAILARDPPRMVFYRPDDKYNTAASRTLIDNVRARYRLIESYGGFEVYELPEHAAVEAEDGAGRAATGRPAASGGG